MTPPWSPVETASMRRALELARRGLGTTSPNPPVGCVLLDATGREVGAGWHERAGGPHAEVVALAAAGARARGATAVVTLEPCAHEGRTGPCTAALLDAGVRRVVFGVPDPTPAGGGATELARGGVDARGGLLAAEAGRLLEPWTASVRLGRPHVLWKFAATLDGRSAAPDGSSRWITSAPSRAEVHELRAAVDAVVVGVGTVLRDDPALTARHPDGSPRARQPLRVVVDSAGRTPPTAAVLAGTGETWVATAGELGAAEHGGVDLAALLASLRRRGVVSVLLEGGPSLAGAFLAAGLVDRVTAYLAPSVLGAGRAAVERPRVTSIADALRLDVDATRLVGGDVVVTGRPAPPSQR